MRRNVSLINPQSPAIITLSEAIEGRFPSIGLLTTNNEHPGTRHTAGLAIDIMLEVRQANEHRRADQLIDVFVRLHRQMRWSDLIYSDYDGTTTTYFHIPGGGGFGRPGHMLERNPYTQDTRHSNHIHLDWVNLAQEFRNQGDEYRRIPYLWSPAATNTAFGPALVAELAALS
ncbi:MAG: hypothetical protein ABI999_02810 [Acidobacteriota bacterium]